MKIVVSTAYWPNLEYLYWMYRASEVALEQHEHYQKQSYRNRTQILSANGILDLTIPICHSGNKQLTREIRISYAERWQQRHWGAITSAYRNSPYFEFFEDEVREFYHQTSDNLFEYNCAQLSLIGRILRSELTWQSTTAFFRRYEDHLDLRNVIHPKIKNTLPPPLEIPYYQTFGEKFGYVKNLSILDLLFNTGLHALHYLKGNALRPEAPAL